MITTPVKLWRRQKKTASLIGKIGEIVQWTIIRTPPKSFMQEAPYPVVIVKLENGKNVIGQLVDWEQEDLIKGRKVVAVLRKLFPETTESVIAYVVKFKPVPLKNESKKIVVSAPGKIHLLGEHVVVYGKPSILGAVDKRCFVEITPRNDNVIEIISKNYKQSIKTNEEKIIEKTKFSREKWQEFVKSNNKDVLRSITGKPFDYVQICIGEALLTYKQQLSSGFTLIVNSNVLSGMGSSSSLAVAVSGAITLFLNKPFDKKIINEIAFSSEQKQHGFPSGGDNSVSTYGGFVWYRKEMNNIKIIQPLSLEFSDKVSNNLFVIDTGKPKESTGEMVSIVKKFVQDNKELTDKIFNDQEGLTRNLFEALKSGAEKEIISIIKNGEDNLEKLGVVSDFVKKVIRKIEESGGAAKICGAGGKSKSTGIILVYHSNSKQLENLLKSYNLSCVKIVFNGEGVKIEPFD